MSFKLGSLSIIVLMIGSFNPAFAQHAINGRIIDEYGAPLPYASIVLLTPADSTMQYFKVADNKGLYEIKGIIADDYLMQFSFATKETIYANVTIPADRGEGFGDQILKAAMREALQVVAEYIPIEIKQDTVAFNARAFKTAPGAVVEDLLAKIPGIEVDETGNVKALGENVSRVLVDGKEFFGTDPKVATKNLPAGAVEKVQVYDKRSEEAEFMGIDDGVRDRTINLLLNEDSKKGYFGSNELGGGTGEFFKTGGKIYRFSSNFQSALLGMYNNVNEFKFTGKNQGQFGQQVSGLNTTTAGGLNLSYNTEGSNRYFASYLVNSTKTSLVQKKSTRNYIVGDSFLQVEDMTENERNTPHELNVGVRHNVGRLHSMSIDGNLDMAADKLASKVKAATRQNGSLVNDLDNITTNRSELLNGDVRAVHIAKLNGDLT
ncbi:MAG: carboxypeptidase regulatory-like domain-containing protein, partial [Candidatus Latescibacteria bacterium]|nr:carboxypeptidase regulatory-like domain-containing protein [Candidatus Latescibacterota bacterium]